MATRVKWDLPPGFRAEDLQWPAPQTFKDSSGVTYGYDDQALLLARILPPKNLKAGGEMRIFGEVRWLECRDICIPGKSSLALTLAVRNESPEKNEAASEIFSKARRKIQPPISK